MAEYFDVVDEHDVPARRETRVEIHRQRLLHRAVHVLVFNPRGEIYLQRRSAHKDTYPHRWTTSCSGHVDAGENYDQAVLRELGEELGLKKIKLGMRNEPGVGQLSGKLETRNSKLETSSSSTLLQPFLKHSPCRETGWEFIWIYTLTTDAEPRPDPGEISEGRWLAPAELDAWMAREPKAFTPSFCLVWKLWRER
jgi:isopentenyl-diphosphate Delta-isomerase